MSKSDMGHGLLKDQTITADEEVLTQRSNEVPSPSRRDRDSVTPFAKDMVNNVVSGALSVLDTSRKEGKPWKDVLAAKKISSDTLEACESIRSMDGGSAVDSIPKEGQVPSFSSADPERPVVQVMHLQVRDDSICNSSVHAEQVARIVKGLQDIQIGDSAYVLPADGSNIEKQVKRAVRNINSLEFGDMETAQLIICDGQGDVDAKIMEAEVGPAASNITKPQNDTPVKISTSFLHKMIEELEDDDGAKGSSPIHGDRERIATWEESEEKFIRVIEGPGYERASGSLVEDHEDREQLDRHSLEVGEEIDSQNEKFEASLSHGRHVFIQEDAVLPDENFTQPRDLLDNCVEEEPYWCTAGLITAVASPPSHRVFTSRTTIIGTESRISAVEHTLQGKTTETSISESVSVAERREDELQDNHAHSEGKLKKKKKTFGQKLRKFFSRFKRDKGS